MCIMTHRQTRLKLLRMRIYTDAKHNLVSNILKMDGFDKAMQCAKLRIRVVEFQFEI